MLNFKARLKEIKKQKTKQLYSSGKWKVHSLGACIATSSTNGVPDPTPGPLLSSELTSS